MLRKTAMFLMLVLVSSFAFGANVKDFGAKGDNSTDDTIAIQAAIDSVKVTGGEVYFPIGIYKVSATINVTPLKCIKLRGDGMQFSSTLIVGYVPGDLVYLNSNFGPFYISGLAFRNRSTDARSALHVENLTNGVIEWCLFASSGAYGIYANYNIFTLTIRDCKINGAGFTGIGILTSSHTNIQSCDISGWNEGIRAYGTTVNITGCRTEVNRIGFNLGMKEDGTYWSLSRSIISGNSFEANDIAIAINAAQYCTFTGMGMQGSTVAPSGQSQIGMYVRHAQWCSFSSLGVWGNYSDKGVKILNGLNQHWETTAIYGGLFLQPGLINIVLDPTVTIY